jgi:hypothetical protein
MTAADSPPFGLSATYIGVTRSFSALSYLMWKSNLTGSILVPLGYVPWNWSGSAVGSIVTGIWSLNTNPPSTWSQQPTLAQDPNNSGYPTWDPPLVVNGVCTNVTTNEIEEQ